MKLHKTIGWLLSLTPLLGLVGCESDDMPGSGQGELVPVTIHLEVEGSGLVTRANGYANVGAEDDDAITSLDVYIMNGTTVEQHLTWDQFEENVASDIKLTTGEKHVYAIANYYAEGETAPETAPDNIAVDALSKIGETIPMSADTTWRIDANTTSCEVQLTRMVAQMKVSIVMGDGDGTETIVASPTISDFKIEKLLPSHTSLYAAEGSFSLPANIGDLTDWSWQDAKVGEENTTSFYLHETSGTFTVSLNDGTRTRSNTFTRTVQRNQILPLVIHLSDYRLDFNGSSYQHGPIGVIKNPLISGYTIELPEGASAVNLKVALKNADNVAIAGVDWSYELTQTGTLTKLELGELSADENDILTILDNYNFSAGLTGTITLELKATFTDSGKTKTQLFPITINVVSIEEAITRANAPTRPIVVEL